MLNWWFARGKKCAKIIFYLRKNGRFEGVISAVRCCTRATRSRDAIYRYLSTLPALSKSMNVSVAFLRALPRNLVAERERAALMRLIVDADTYAWTWFRSKCPASTLNSRERPTLPVGLVMQIVNLERSKKRWLFPRTSIQLSPSSSPPPPSPKTVEIPSDSPKFGILSEWLLITVIDGREFNAYCITLRYAKPMLDVSKNNGKKRTGLNF